MDITETSQHSLLARFSEFLAQQIGLHFPPERECDLLRGIEAAARDFGFQDAGACMQWLLSTPLDRNRIEILACHLTVGETYFFRDPQVFEALKMHILPALIQSRRSYGQTFRLWSAGCATGEEAYSLAILVQRMIPDFKQWHITILATDINPHALAKAESGSYGEWSFRNAPIWLKSGYFRPIENGRYEIIPSVREMVTFAYLNLMEDAYPSPINNTNAMDIIFCRNVMMYFKPGQATQVMRRHCLTLVDGGWLVINPTEAYRTMTETMDMVNFSGTVLYQKIASGTTPGSVESSQARPEPLEQIRIDPAATKRPSRKPELVAVDKASFPSRSSDYGLALTLFQQGRYAEASAQAVRLLSSWKTKVQAMTLLARIDANKGDLAGARQWCMQAINADCLNPAGHYLMAIVLLEQGRTDDSMQELKRTLYLDPDYVLAYFTLATLYRQLGRHKEAGKHFENALLLLDALPPEEVLPEAEGMTAGRLAEIIHTLCDQEKSA
ncbi:CheR family methyltransferase [Methylobacter sp.]|uniref:CheR family methyltransferase n=1 Tax=Methylobacter sp. TaxID=2051955 RepID=UPI002FDDBD69